MVPPIANKGRVMSGSQDNSTIVPKILATDLIAGQPVLLSMAKCWEECRKGKLLPLKKDFEGAILEYPEVLPDMTIVEMSPDGDLTYLYIGGDRATRRGHEDTGTAVRETLHPKAAELIFTLAIAAFERPFALHWWQRNILPSGAVAEDYNLGVGLADEDGNMVAIAIASQIDPVYLRETEKGGYLIGSGGMGATPIDLGLGVPDLPLNLDPDTL